MKNMKQIFSDRGPAPLTRAQASRSAGFRSSAIPHSQAREFPEKHEIIPQNPSLSLKIPHYPSSQVCQGAIRTAGQLGLAQASSPAGSKGLPPGVGPALKAPPQPKTLMGSEKLLFQCQKLPKGAKKLPSAGKLCEKLAKTGQNWPSPLRLAFVRSLNPATYNPHPAERRLWAEKHPI